MAKQRMHAVWRRGIHAFPRLLLGLLWLAAMPLPAQQFTTPGSTRAPQGIPEKTFLEEQMEDSPWRLGGVRVQPWFGIQDASLVTNTNQDGESDEDFTVTVGAGLRAYTRTGPKVVWSAHALPEYVWWSEQDDKRSLNGRLGLGVFGYFNRLNFEISGRRDKRQSFFSPERQELTTNQSDILRLSLEVKLTDCFAVFASGESTDFENQEDSTSADIFASLDREETRLRGGFTYRAPSGWQLSLGIEDRESDFDTAARNLSNTGEEIFLAARYPGNRFELDLLLADSSLDPQPGSSFVPSSETVGRLQLLWRLGSQASLMTYGRQRRNFAISAGNSFLLSQRFGARLQLNFEPLWIDLIAETGDDEFEPIAPLDPRRVDDATGYGIHLTIPFARRFQFSLRSLFTDFDSNFDSFDRDVDTISMVITLRDLDRLRLGRPDGTW